MNRNLAVGVTLGLTVLAGVTGLPHDASRAAAAPARPWHEDADHMGSGLTARMPAGTVHNSATVPAPDLTATLKGLDVSAFQENIDWPSVASKGASFAYVKATEGIDYTSSQFSKQYNGSAAAGLIRGAYHFALPNTAGGSAQADYFVAHGGGWSDDGRTLPGALDIEYNPYGATCYGLSQSAMVPGSPISAPNTTPGPAATRSSTPPGTGGPPAPATPPRPASTTPCGSPTTAVHPPRCRTAGTPTRSGRTPTATPSPATRTSSTAPPRTSAHSPTARTPRPRRPLAAAGPSSPRARPATALPLSNTC